MRVSVIVMGLMSLPLWSGVAMADLRGRSEQPPTFTAAENEIISRNELLAKMVATDPWLVRRTLDRLEAGGKGGTASATRTVKAPPDGFDPTRNPDLADSDRNSPEAAYDLFQLIKQAAAEKKK